MKLDDTSQPMKLLGWDDLRAKGITASKPTIYRWVKAETFPRPIYIGKSPCWPEGEIDNHIQSLIAQRDATKVA